MPEQNFMVRMLLNIEMNRTRYSTPLRCLKLLFYIKCILIIFDKNLFCSLNAESRGWNFKEFTAQQTQVDLRLSCGSVHV